MLLGHNLDTIEELSHGLRFGDSSRFFPGSDHRYKPQTELQYGTGQLAESVGVSSATSFTGISSQ